jgi:Na+-translocating ferredoxin:NAD+ oxidoreductase RnfG subunit
MQFDRIEKAYPFVFLTIILCVFSVMIAMTYRITTSLLESQQDPETMSILQSLFPEAKYYSYNVDNKIYTVSNSNMREIGYAFYG